jgi:hypothetical protein
MRIVDATTLRDGGTTCVALDDGQQVQHVTFDYSLPWDGQTRFIYVSNETFNCNENNRLDLGSEEEDQIIGAIHEAAIREYGALAVEEFLRDPSTNPGEDIWFYVFNFLRIAIAERGSSSHLAKYVDLRNGEGE